MAEPTYEEIKEILHLPMDAEGDAILNKRLETFGSEFTYKEKLFVLFYTSPNSRYCGKINPSGKATGGSWKGYGSWALQQPHVKKAVRQLCHKNMLDKLEAFFEEDIQRNMNVISADRSSFRKDNEFTFDNDKGDEITVERITDKPLYELDKKQREAIADFEYDKSGNAHYVIESRSQARQNLLNYYKILGANNTSDEEAAKTTETVVTLEGIKDKATAKIKIIQHNNEDAIKAGEFIDKMNDVDEEA